MRDYVSEANSCMSYTSIGEMVRMVLKTTSDIVELSLSSLLVSIGS